MSSSLISEYPVELTNEQLDVLDGMIQKHEALGNYPVKKVWGPYPVLVGYISTARTLTVEFSNEDEDTGLVKYYLRSRRYNLAKSLEDQGEWSETLEGDVDSHTFSIHGLRNNSLYEIKMWAKATIDGKNWYAIPTYETYLVKTEAE